MASKSEGEVGDSGGDTVILADDFEEVDTTGAESVISLQPHSTVLADLLPKVLPLPPPPASMFSTVTTTEVK